MLKRQSKKLAIMLVLSMIASLFVGVGAASAANGVAVSISRVISAESDAGFVQLGNLQIKEDSDYLDAFAASGDSFVITLPSNLKWDAAKYANGNVDTNCFVKISGSYTMTVDVYGDVNGTAKDTYTIPMYVKFDGVEEGYAYATIDPLDSPVPGGDYAIANVLDGGTSAVVVDDFTAGPDTTTNFTARITETTVGTLAGSEDKVKLTLSPDVDFRNVTISALGGFSGADYQIPDSQIDGHKAWFWVKDLGFDFTETGDTARGIMEIVADVDIDAAAGEGDVELDIEGEDDIDDETLNVGVIAEYGVALSVDDPTTVLAGRVCQELGTVVIWENVADTLSDNRSISITLPDGVKFAGNGFKASDIDVKKGNADIVVTKGDDESELTFKLEDKNAASRLKLEIEMDKLNIRSDFVGDIVAEVSGRAGVEGEIVLGTVVAPVEVKVETVSDVKIGYQAQALSDILITETETGAMLEDGYVVVSLPAGLEFQDKEVEVEVTEGNLEITDVRVKAATDRNNAYVEFKIDSESTANKPSTVTISNVLLDVDRTVAEGPIKATVKGTALVHSYEDYAESVFEGVLADEYDVDIMEGCDREDFLFSEDELVRFVIANCVTPGVQDVVEGAEAATSTFVIGSTAASIAGADVTMPVAPYISNSRTQLPVRYIAYACGVPEANVIWNPDNQTVTLLNNNGTVVQLTIGSTTMQVNGVAIVLDVAPEITGGYTFLPARYVANAFNYDAAWEAATQTVTLTPIAR